jgi:N-acetylneuraminate synthase
MVEACKVCLEATKFWGSPDDPHFASQGVALVDPRTASIIVMKENLMNWDLSEIPGLPTGDDLMVATYVPVIAEIGINHNGDLDTALKLISLAKRCGCDAVKFQKRTVDVVYPPDVLEAPRESPWGATQRDQKEGLEFGVHEYEQIDAFCRDLEIDWSASAWDLGSLEFIESFAPPFHKIASALLTHQSLVEAVAGLGRPTLISTGMATSEVVDEAVATFRKSGTPFALMHTVSTYPTPEVDLNLALIRTLRRAYSVPVGYSGHEPSVSPSILAAALGAQVLERHITLDRSMYGSDQSASLEEPGLRQLVTTVRKLPQLIGSGVKDWAPGEAEVAAKLRYWES